MLPFALIQSVCLSVTKEDEKSWVKDAKDGKSGEDFVVRQRREMEWIRRNGLRRRKGPMEDVGWIKECEFCGNSLWLLLETEKVRQRVKRREGLFRASAWRGPLFILPFWAEGDRRVSHATRRHPAGQPRKGAIAAGKEGLAIGINYSEWKGLCLPFSPLFLKGAREGKNSTPTTGCPLRFWKGSAFQVTNLTSLHPHRPPNSLHSHLLWNAPGFVVLQGPGSVCLMKLHNFKMCMYSYCGKGNKINPINGTFELLTDNSRMTL